MVQIITDSSTLYTREEAKAAGFEAVPLCVTIGDMEGRDCHIDMDAFYGKISEGFHPSSSQPPIGEVVDVYEDNITVINSKTLCGPHRYMVEKAQAMKEAGCSAKEIIDWVNAAAEKHESFLIPQDFDFLRRGGRLTPVTAAFGSMLKLKPIMTQTPDGKRLDKFSCKSIKRCNECERSRRKSFRRN